MMLWLVYADSMGGKSEGFLEMLTQFSLFPSWDFTTAFLDERDGVYYELFISVDWKYYVREVKVLIQCAAEVTASSGSFLLNGIS